MNEYIFSDYISSNLSLTDEQLSMLCEGSKVIEFKRKEIVLAAGEICKHRFFIERGAVREYSIDKGGREHTLHFATEGWFLMSVDGVFFSRPSSYFIEAIEPTRVLLLNNEHCRRLARVDKVFEEFDHRLLYEHIHTLQWRVTSLQSSSAEERYLEFVERYPQAMIRIPQLMVASYLGITPESLSRIRTNLAKRYQTGGKKS